MGKRGEGMREGEGERGEEEAKEFMKYTETEGQERSKRKMENERLERENEKT